MQAVSNMKLEELKALARHIQLPVNRENYAQMHDRLQEAGLAPGDLYQELEMSSRYVQFHQDASYADAIMQLHSYHFYEVLCCRNSCGAEYLVGAERYRLQKGDIIFIAPGTSHRPLLPNYMQEPYIRDVLWISTEFVQLLQKQFPQPSGHSCSPGSSLLRTAGTQWSFLVDILHGAVIEAEHQSDGWEMLTLSMGMTFIAHLKRAFQDPGALAIMAEKPDLLERVLAYIEDNLAEKMTLADTARHFFVSESTISQIFRRQMGVSFYRCVTQRRLIAAKRLILEHHSLEAVAARTGFSEYSAFYRAFRQEYGISPRHYRNLQMEKSEGL